MSSLEELHVNELLHIIDESNRKLCTDSAALSTGFVPYFIRNIAEVAKMANSHLPNNAISLDLGCGNGAFTLLRAQYGPSYGIDINPTLIETARNLKMRAQSIGCLPLRAYCMFAVGNIHQGYNENAYSAAAKTCSHSRAMPLSFGENPYEKLGIQIHNADLIYAYVWPQHMRTLCQLLRENTKKNAVFILPNYQPEYLLEFPLYIVGKTSYGLPLRKRV